MKFYTAMNRLTSLRILCLFALATSALCAKPEWTEKLTPSSFGSHPPIESCKLEYSLSWKGVVKAGYFDLQFAPKTVSKPGFLVVTSKAYSLGVAKKLFPYEHNYWSELKLNTLEPSFFESTESDSKEKVVTTNHYSPVKVEINEVTTNISTSKETTFVKSFDEPNVRDLISAILFIRSQKLDVGDTHVMLILPFRSPYLLTIHVEAKEKHEGKDAIRLSIAMQKIKFDTHELLPYKKIKKPVKLWLSDDIDRIPLEVRASAYIGDVRAVLVKHTKTP